MNSTVCHDLNSNQDDVKMTLNGVDIFDLHIFMQDISVDFVNWHVYSLVVFRRQWIVT